MPACASGAMWPSCCRGGVGRYQTLLHAVPDPKLNAVLARVIGRASRPFLQTMVLDAGRGDHVLPGEAVMDARGMIGRIYLAGERTSWVILLTDINSRIPVTIAPSSAKDAAGNGHGNIQAMMTGDNTANPALDMVSRLVTLHAGDQVVSSGDGGLLPPGLPIGTVVSDGREGWRVGLAGRSGLQPGCRGPELLQAARSAAAYRAASRRSRRPQADDAAAAAGRGRARGGGAGRGQAQAGSRGSAADEGDVDR